MEKFSEDVAITRNDAENNSVNLDILPNWEVAPNLAEIDLHNNHTISNNPVLQNCNINNYNFDEGWDLESVKQRLDNIELKNALIEAKQNIKVLNDKLIQCQRLHHKLSQDLEYEKIQNSNLYNIKFKLEVSLRNLQANKDYVYKLLGKKRRANFRIVKLIESVKRLQFMVKQKNAIIAKYSHNNNRLLEQASRIIKESYSIL